MEPLGHPVESFEQLVEIKKEVDNFVNDQLCQPLTPALDSLLLPTLELENEIVNEAIAFDLLDYLTLHFIYINPLPLPPGNNNDNIDAARWALLLKNVGLSAETGCHTPMSELGKSIADFLHGLLLLPPAGPPAQSWDFNPSSHCPILAGLLLSKLMKIQDTFIVNPAYFVPKPPYNYTIAVFNATNAVKIY